MTASTYASITRAVDQIVADERDAADQTVCAYMIARAALLRVRASHGSDKASSMAYALADELATSDAV